MQQPPFRRLFYILNIAISIVLELVVDDPNIIVVSPCILTYQQEIDNLKRCQNRMSSQPWLLLITCCLRLWVVPSYIQKHAAQPVQMLLWLFTTALALKDGDTIATFFPMYLLIRNPNPPGFVDDQLVS